MIGFIARLIGGAVSPLVDRASAFGASLLRKLALFLVAAVSMVVVVIALTVAFDLWIASMAGAIAGALAVAGLYLVIAIVAAVLALRGGSRPSTASAEAASAADAARQRGSAKNETIDQFTAPILSLLASLGLRREQLAVLAGAGFAKQIGPVPLVGLAIVAGFMIGRMWRGFDALASSDLVQSVMDLFTPAHDPSETSDEAA